MKATIKFLFKTIFYSLILVILLLALFIGSMQTETGQDLFTKAISKIYNKDGKELNITKLRGRFPHNLTFEQLDHL